MIKQFLAAYFIFISHFFSVAQDISGFWKGTLNMNSGCFAVNNIEIQITRNGDSIFGSSYHYLDVDNYVKKKFTGSYHAEQKKIYLQEELVTTVNIPSYCKVCIKKYELNYNRNVNLEILEGDWTGIIAGTYIDCGAGPVKLTRIKESAFKEIHEITVDTGEIRLDFYDNALIDGDSISVRVNNKLVLIHQKLGAEPITLITRIEPKTTFQEVEIIAENLGTIPPNTALLIVTAGKKRYELFLTSSERKSAKVRFLYEKVP